jgi:hypothetical protein
MYVLCVYVLCVYVCTYVCTYVCMYVCMYVFYVCMFVSLIVCCTLYLPFAPYAEVSLLSLLLSLEIGSLLAVSSFLTSVIPVNNAA